MFAIRYFTKVIKLEEKTASMPATLAGYRIDEKGVRQAVWDVPRQKLGWFILMAGSRESLFVGEEKPEIEVGDQVEVVIQKI